MQKRAKVLKHDNQASASATLHAHQQEPQTRNVAKEEEQIELQALTAAKLLLFRTVNRRLRRLPPKHGSFPSRATALQGQLISQRQPLYALA